MENAGSYTYTVTAEAPQALQPGCPNLSNVPLTAARGECRWGTARMGTRRSHFLLP